MAVLSLLTSVAVASVLSLSTVAGSARLPGTTEEVRHLGLRASDPSDGDTLDVSPGRIRLEFTQSVDEGAGRVTLIYASGRETALEVSRDPNDDRVLMAAVRDLETGSYRVRWHVVSPDGHPVSDSFVFYVILPATEPPVLAEPPPAVSAEDPTGPPTPAAILRGLAVGFQMALAGVLFIALWFGPSTVPALKRVVPWLAVAAVVTVGGHAWLWVNSISPSGALSFGGAFATATGRMEGVRVALILLALWALVLARRPGLALAFAVGSILADAGIGHAASMQPLWAVPSKAVHLLAAAVWLGGLVVVALHDWREPNFRSVVTRVSSAALAAVVAIVVTGIVQTILVAPRPLELIGSSYGLLVGAKVLGLGALIAFGARHRFRLIPKMAMGAESAAQRDSDARWPGR